MRKIYLTAIMPLVLLLAGCPSHKTKTSVVTKSYNVSGKAELGYFDPKEAKCIATMLDSQMIATGKTKSFGLSDDSTFEFKADANEYISIQCDVSYKKTEIATSQPNPASIMALGDLTQSSVINVNIGTTMETESIRAKFKQGVEFAEAEEAVRSNLFNVAQLIVPDKMSSSLTKADLSIRGLEHWMFGLIQMNHGAKTLDQIIKELNPMFIKRDGANTTSLTLPVSAAEIGSLGDIEIAQVKMATKKTFSMEKKLYFRVPKTSVNGFVSGHDHVLLQGVQGSDPIELKEGALGYTWADIRSLFDPAGRTIFTICAVAKVLKSCDGLTAPSVETFTLTGQAAQVGSFSKIYINRKDSATWKVRPFFLGGAGSTVSMRIENVNSSYNGTHHIIIETRDPSIPSIKIETQGPNGYETDKLKDLLDPDGTTLLKICAVPIAMDDCSQAKKADMSVIQVKTALPPSLDSLKPQQVQTTDENSKWKATGLTKDSGPFSFTLHRGVLHNFDSSLYKLVMTKTFDITKPEDRVELTEQSDGDFTADLSTPENLKKLGVATVVDSNGKVIATGLCGSYEFYVTILWKTEIPNNPEVLLPGARQPWGFLRASRLSGSKCMNVQHSNP